LLRDFDGDLDVALDTAFDFDVDAALDLAAARGFGWNCPDLLRLPSTERPPASIIAA